MGLAYVEKKKNWEQASKHIRPFAIHIISIRFGLAFSLSGVSSTPSDYFQRL